MISMPKYTPDDRARLQKDTAEFDKNEAESNLKDKQDLKSKYLIPSSISVDVTKEVKDFKGSYVAKTVAPFKCSKAHREIEVGESYNCHIPDCGFHTHKLTEFRGHFNPQISSQHEQYNPFKEMSQADLYTILEITIKGDEESACIVFYNMLLAQTDDSQFNVVPIAQSSTGKTYILFQCADFFPSNEIIRIDSSSPTAVIHDDSYPHVIEKDNHELVSVDSLLIPLKTQLNDLSKQDKKERQNTEIERITAAIEEIKSLTKRFVNFKNKIIIMTDQNSLALIEKLRPVFSHDLSKQNRIDNKDPFYRTNITV